MVYRYLSEHIIDGVIEVHQSLGPGLLECCYHNGLYYALQDKGLVIGYNAAFPVFFKNHQVGEYFADLVVNGKIIIEVKSVGGFHKAMEAQLLNYMHISGCRLGFLVNFKTTRPDWRRMVL